MSIIICYSILEELKLNIITKQNENSLISEGTKWNPEVYSRLSDRLTECGLCPDSEIMWLSRNGIDRPFKSKLINVDNKCEWSDGEIINDFNIKLTDAILEVSYMRSKLASHNVGDRVTLLCVYDAENAFHFARIILLDYFKIKLILCACAWKRGMLLGAIFVLNVPLQYKSKPTSPRDADTAEALCLVICSVPAVCELPVSLREREFVPSDCDIKINTIHEGWCSFLWRRKRDSNPRGFWPNGFQGSRAYRTIEENNGI